MYVWEFCSSHKSIEKTTLIVEKGIKYITIKLYYNYLFKKLIWGKLNFMVSVFRDDIN